MKSLWKVVKRMTKAVSDKVTNAVDSIFSDNIRARKLGILVVSVGVGLIAISYVNV